MARLFDDASNQYMRNTNAIVSSYPVTMVCWFTIDTDGTDRWLISICDYAEPTVADLIGMRPMMSVAGDPLRAQPDGNAGANTTTGISLDTWHHGATVFTNSTSRAVYIDGGSKGTNATAFAWGTPTDTMIGTCAFNSSFLEYHSGMIAEVAIWNVALTDAEVAILAAGYSPLLVRPQSLVSYWPLLGETSPEIDVVGGYDMTLYNAPTAAEHPPMLYLPRAKSTFTSHPFLTSLVSLAPNLAVPTTSNPATLGVRNRHLVLNFDDTTNESTVFDFIMPQHFTGPDIGVILHFSAASATSGYAKIGASFERIGDGQQDVDSDSFASANSKTIMVPATSGYVKKVRVRFNAGADMDSVAAGEKCRLKITRLADDSADDMSGDLELHLVDVRSA